MKVFGLLLGGSVLKKKHNGILIIEKKAAKKRIEVFYPQVVINNNPKKEKEINEVIKKIMHDLIKDEYDRQRKNKVYGNYEIKLNNNELLSLVFEASSFEEGRKESFTATNSITIDLKNNRILDFEDIFVENSYYELIINKLITDSIEKNDTPHIQEFVNIDKSKSFYVTKDSLVIYVPLYKDTSYANYYCVPEFNIPLREISGIVQPKGPLDNLIK